ncbi:MAG: CHAD domain containing protein [Anaerolinea thermophila]|uniref:CHAD domain containing protein n=1 Tax=Anaerolinea thermophila TaxID=167964 RepID=A0A101FXG8_9CHLR|nr:MAG: CHAD domain containing protein [Anaerolinea thermophila]
METKDQIEIYRFGAAYILDQVNQFEGEIEGALKAQGIEYVHRMRVASRRLRTALNLFSLYLPDDTAQIWRYEFKGITKALGQARDLDIQIQLIKGLLMGDVVREYKPGYRRLLLRLKQNRKNVQERVKSAIEILQKKETLNRIRTVLKKQEENQGLNFPPVLYQTASESIQRGLEDFLSYQKYIHSPSNGEPLHAMRIAGKHLRYTMEIFAPIYKQSLFPFIEIMEEIQDQLGEIHDCDVWVAWLPEFIALEQNRRQGYIGYARRVKRLLPGIHHLIEDRKLARQQGYHAFLENWQKQKDEQTWEKLSGLIDPTSAVFNQTQ